MKWATARLSEVASIRHGGTPSKKVPRFWNGDIPWVSPKDMGGSVLTDTEDHITADAVACSATSVMPANSIFLVARSGVLAHSVPVALALRPMAFNQDIKAITVDAARLDAEYALWCLRSQQGRILVQGVKRGATVHSLHSGFVENLSIPLPPLDVQRRIVDILNRANGIRRLRREALDRTRQLIPALFIDMFGDPTTNPRVWPVVALDSVIAQGPQNGLYRPGSDYGEGTPIVRIDSFYAGQITRLRELRRLTLDAKSIEKYALQEGDILINRVNSRPFLGKSAIVPALLEPTVFESNMMRLAVDRSCIDPRYVIIALQHGHVREQLLTRAKDAINQSSVNQDDVRAIRLQLPPIVLQKAFVERVADIQATIVQQERMAQASEQLVAALMARLFDGASSKLATLAALA